MEENLLTLARGRSLCYAEFGAPHGKPVFYCHGFPGSRLEAAFAEDVALSIGARVIAADRPGIGMSDAHPGRSVLAWADDVAALAEHLEIETFSVLGVSGGAPYALACAYRFVGRLRSTAIVSGLAPPRALSATPIASTAGLGLRLAKAVPFATLPVCRLLGLAARRATPLLMSVLTAKACPLDRRALAIEDFRASLAASLREAFRNGAGGAVTDLRLLSSPWDFELAGVRAPIALWHGIDDRVVPITMGRHLEQSLADCRATYLPGHGHYSLVHDYAGEVLSYLVDYPCRSGLARE